MRREITRSLLIGLATIAVGVTAQAGYLLFACAQRQAWIHAHTGRPVVMLTHQYGVPRPGDAMFVCETPHRVGPLVLHMDLNCYCAPPATPADELAADLGGGSCTPKDELPSLEMASRACAPAYCDAHFDATGSGDAPAR